MRGWCLSHFECVFLSSCSTAHEEERALLFSRRSHKLVFWVFSASLIVGLIICLLNDYFCIYNRFCIYVNIISHSTPYKEKKLGVMVWKHIQNSHIALVRNELEKQFKNCSCSLWVLLKSINWIRLCLILDLVGDTWHSLYLTRFLMLMIKGSILWNLAMMWNGEQNKKSYVMPLLGNSGWFPLFKDGK